MLRYSLSGLLFFTVVAAMGCAALFGRSPWWGSAVVSGTLVMLAAAALLAIYRRHAARAFWLGFAVCGWMYLFVMFGPWFFGELRDDLLTTRVLALLAQLSSQTPGDSAEVRQAKARYDRAESDRVKADRKSAFPRSRVAERDRLLTARNQAYSDYRAAIAHDEAASQRFYRTGHSLWAWLFAIFGGFLASMARRSADRDER